MLICVKHGRALVTVKNSVYLEELTEGTPYRIWSTDLWGCPYPFCNISIAVAAEEPVAEYWQTNYDDVRRRLVNTPPEAITATFHQ